MPYSKQDRDQLSELNIGDNLLKLENKITELVGLKLGNMIKQSCDKTERSYANITAKRARKLHPHFIRSTNNCDQQNEFNIFSSFRIQGILEDHKKTIDANLVRTTEAVKSILKFFEVDTEITSMKCLGKFTKERTKLKTLLVTVRN